MEPERKNLGSREPQNLSTTGSANLSAQTTEELR